MAVSYKKLFHILIDRIYPMPSFRRWRYSANITTRLKTTLCVAGVLEKICRVLIAR